MKLGDLVRAIHGVEEGIIVSMDKNRVEIEDQEGFLIPFQKSELVLIKESMSVENDKLQVKESFGSQQVVNKRVDPGLYLALVPSAQKDYEVYFLNTSKYEVIATFGHSVGKGNTIEFRSNFACGKNAFKKIDKLELQNSPDWPTFSFDILYFQKGLYDWKAPGRYAYKLTAKKLLNKFTQLPILEQEGILFRLDQSSQAVNSLNREKGKQKPEVQMEIDDPGEEVDLHFNMLPLNYRQRSGSELENQVKYFQDLMDHCLRCQRQKIVFIHGVGQGVLKSEIIKRLSKRKDIKFFKDAKKEKFGYGGTEVVFY
jgi:hypothetical protein